MADYRLSAQVISRGKGQSSIASAAYRAAARLDDPRTGEIHDYTRKQGVVYSAVLAPDDAPDWMRDRSQLWQAFEAAEKRRDAQLARELQLSLPHELDQEQRQALLLNFVRAEFVNQGMIADVALHEPSREGDERNHHAHVMLTMRSLTGEGFGNKVREWNDAETLLRWREEWAHHQNRALERHGHAARVDHRSYEDRGIDREPSQHLGPTAADMERKGKASRIGDENRTASFNNASRADRYREHWDIEAQRDHARAQFDGWAQRKAAEISHSIDVRFDADRRQLSARHGQQSDQLGRQLADQYGPHKSAIGSELTAVDRRLQATGVRKLMRGIFGRTKADEKARQDLARVLRSIEQREHDAKRALERRQATEIAVLRDKTEAGRRRRLDGIERRRQERDRAGWIQQHRREADSKPVQEAFRAAAKEAAAEPSKAPQATPEAQPWASNVLDNARPWESDFSRSAEPTRERSPQDDGPKNAKE